MKVLIHNYTNDFTTEPLYLDQCFNQAGIQSAVWDDAKISAFDAFDMYTPDIVIYHYSGKRIKDIIKYMSKNTKINLIINITGAQEGHVQILENLIEKNLINCPFFVSNLHYKIYSVKSKKKILNLLPGVDLFLPKQNVPTYKLQAGILSNNKHLAEKAIQKFETYHKIGIGVQDEYFDFNVSALNMTSLYDRYEKIVLAADLPVAFSQFFFDAVYKSSKLVLRTNDEQKSGQILADLFEGNEEDEDVATYIKDQIKKKHTCLNRTAKLLRELNNTEAAQKIQGMIENL